MRLTDVAPRLARAHSERRWEVACIDGDDFRAGDDLRRLTRVSYDTTSHQCACGGWFAMSTYTGRMLVGANTGSTVHGARKTCQRCGKQLSACWGDGSA